MGQIDDAKMLKVVLLLFAVVTLVYGIGYLVVPGVVVSISGGGPVNLGWIRWSGGTLIALAFGAIMVFRHPSRQRIFVTTISWAALLIGLALLYSWLTGESTSATWFIALPTVVSLGLAFLLRWSGQKAKDVLKAE
jgi:hypothetical protein